MTKILTKFVKQVCFTKASIKSTVFPNSHETMQNNISDWFIVANFNNHTPRALRLLNNLSKKKSYIKFTCEIYDS